MPILMNNCHNRDHAGMYPSSGVHVAFYDLGRRGLQGKQARNLPPGAECVVARYEGARDIRFDWFAFSHEEVRPSKEGEDVRVFFGSPLRTEVLPKAAAVESPLYGAFFDATGGFKHESVIATR